MLSSSVSSWTDIGRQHATALSCFGCKLNLNIRIVIPIFQAKIFRPAQNFFWSAYSGAELDLLFLHRGRRYRVEFKFSEAPKATRSMRIALNDLHLDRLWIIYPGTPLPRRRKAIGLAPSENFRSGRRVAIITPSPSNLK